MDSIYERGYPPDQPGARLTEAVRAVCPADGVSTGRWDDRATWRLDAKQEATPEEIEAAHAVMAAFDPWGEGEAKTDAEITHILTTSGDPPADMVADADEDEGQPAASEIFDEEDVEAAGGVAAYPGIMPLRNELEDLRSDVIRAISDQKRMRLRIAMDPSRADFLSERFATYNNAGALGIEIDDALIADRNAFLEMKSRESAINSHALSLEDAAATADEAKLRAMHDGVGDGWP